MILVPHVADILPATNDNDLDMLIENTEYFENNFDAEKQSL